MSFLPVDEQLPILRRGAVDLVDEAEWDHILDVNLKSMMQCTKAALPAMKRAGGW